MKSKTLLTITAAAALALAGSQPSVAQSLKPKVKADTTKTAPQQVISLETRVETVDTRGRASRSAYRADDTYGVKPAEAIPLQVGERVRVNLVGTSLVNGRGVETPINATFSLSAGRDNLHIVQTGSNWVIVEAKGRGNDKTAQLAYTTNGNYDMKAGLAQGYITFTIDNRGVSDRPVVAQDRDRWQRAEDLTELLYQGILDRNLGGSNAQDDVEHVYYLGYRGVQEVARELAREAANRYDTRWTEDEAYDVVAGLYRELLGRQQTDRQLSEENGFRTNVDNLRRYGIERVVQTIVESEEFRSANDLSGLDRMALNERYDGNWRNNRSRY